MREIRYKGKTEKRVLAAMVMVTKVCERIAVKWSKEGLFDDAYQNLIANWCVDYWKEYGKAPQKNIQAIFENWEQGRNGDATTGLVGKAMEEISRCYEKEEEEDTPEFILDLAEKLFNSVRMTKLNESIEEDLERNATEDAQKRLQEFEPFTFQKEKNPFPLHSMQEILTGKRIREKYLIDKVLVAGQPCIVAGPEKSLKTSLMLDLMLSLTSGENFLGQFEVLQPVNVLLMSGESGLATLEKNIQTIFHYRCRDMKAESFAKKFLLSEAVPRIDNRKHLEQVRKIMEDNNTGVIIIDTASLAMPGKDAPNLMIMQENLAGMTDICREMGVTFVLVHHMSGKNETKEIPKLDNIAYAGFKQWARQWVLLNRRETYEPPEEGEPRNHCLNLSLGGSAGHSSLWALDIDEGTQKKPRWGVTLNTASNARVESRLRAIDKKLDANRNMILALLEKYPDGETKTKLSENSKLNFANLTPVLDSLVADELVEEVKVIKNNRSNDGYRLANTSPTSPTVGADK